MLLEKLNEICKQVEIVEKILEETLINASFTTIKVETTYRVGICEYLTEIHIGIFAGKNIYLLEFGLEFGYYTLHKIESDGVEKVCHSEELEQLGIEDFYVRIKRSEIYDCIK